MVPVPDRICRPTSSSDSERPEILGFFVMVADRDVRPAGYIQSPGLEIGHVVVSRAADGMIPSVTVGWCRDTCGNCVSLPSNGKRDG